MEKVQKGKGGWEVTTEDGTMIQSKNVVISISVNEQLLVPGFSPTRPGNWVEKLIEEVNLHCANCGYPIVNKHLQWCPHLYVMGPLAELQIGPIARNISGARQAAEKIVTSL